MMCYLLSLLSVDLCIGGCKASDQWKLVCELRDALCIHTKSFSVQASLQYPKSPSNMILMKKSYIKDERGSIICGPDDAPHQPTALPHQGWHLLKVLAALAAPGTRSCPPPPPPGPPPPPPCAPETAPRGCSPQPPRSGWHSTRRGPGMLSVKQAFVLDCYIDSERTHRCWI